MLFRVQLEPFILTSKKSRLGYSILGCVILFLYPFILVTFLALIR